MEKSYEESVYVEAYLASLNVFTKPYWIHSMEIAKEPLDLPYN